MGERTGHRGKGHSRCQQSSPGHQLTERQCVLGSTRRRGQEAQAGGQAQLFCRPALPSLTSQCLWSRLSSPGHFPTHPVFSLPQDSFSLGFVLTLPRPGASILVPPPCPYVLLAWLLCRPPNWPSRPCLVGLQSTAIHFWQILLSRAQS